MLPALIDYKKLKALVSEQRIQILNFLSLRNYTVSELSRKLKISKSNTFIHLKKLEEANLIFKTDDGHKWKYYSLSNEGKHLVNGKPILKPLLLILVSLLSGMMWIYWGLLKIVNYIYESKTNHLDHEFSLIPPELLVLLLLFGLLIPLALFSYGLLEFLKTRNSLNKN